MYLRRKNKVLIARHSEKGRLWRESSKCWGVLVCDVLIPVYKCACGLSVAPTVRKRGSCGANVYANTFQHILSAHKAFHCPTNPPRLSWPVHFNSVENTEEKSLTHFFANQTFILEISARRLMSLLFRLLHKWCFSWIVFAHVKLLTRMRSDNGHLVGEWSMWHPRLSQHASRFSSLPLHALLDHWPFPFLNGFPFLPQRTKNIASFVWTGWVALEFGL